MKKRNYIPILVVMQCLATQAAYADGATDKLLNMAKKIAEARQFSVSIHMGYDVVQASGQKIEFSELRKLTVRRPNHLRVDTLQSDGDKSRLIYDGRAITQFSENENVYSRTERTGDLDSVIRYVVGKMGIRVPLARLLLTSLPQELQKLSNKLEYVERNTLGTIPTDHIAGRTDNVDYQVWIAEDKLPRRIVLTYINSPGQPQFQADFSGWNMKPKIPDMTFVFTPPKGAEKIPALLPVTVSKAVGNTSGGAK